MSSLCVDHFVYKLQAETVLMVMPQKTVRPRRAVSSHVHCISGSKIVGATLVSTGKSDFHF